MLQLEGLHARSFFAQAVRVPFLIDIAGRVLDIKLKVSKELVRCLDVEYAF
jgi:hypothetical protein